MIDINLYPHISIVRDGRRFIIATDNDKYVTLESETYLTDNIDFATRSDSDDLADFLHYHIDDIISK